MLKRGRARKKNVAHVIGVSMTPVTKTLTRSHWEVSAGLLKEALQDCGLDKDDIDTLIVTPPNLAGPPSFMYACELASYLGLNLKTLNMVECGGTTSAVALKTAMMELFSGRASVAAVLAVDQRFDINPESIDINVFLHTAIMTQMCLYGPFDGMYGIGAPIPYYAMSAQRYMYEYKAREEDFAEVAVILRKHAQKNPLAEYKNPITVEDVMNSRYLSPPIKLLDCSPFASGGACVIMTKPDISIPLKKNIVRVIGIGEYHDSSHFIPQDKPITEFESVIRASREAYNMADVSPEDINVAEVYGVFTATEIMIYEDLGFFPKGEGFKAVKDGLTTFGGRIVINPSGGRLSLGHPAGATPLMEFVEVVRQLRGECGERQVPNPRAGLVHAEHGMLNGSIVFIMEA